MFRPLPNFRTGGHYLRRLPTDHQACVQRRPETRGYGPEGQVAGRP